MYVCARCETVQLYRCSGIKLCCFVCSDYHVNVVALNRWIVRNYDNNASVTEAAVVGNAETLIACSLYRVPLFLPSSHTVVTTGRITAYMYNEAVAYMEPGLYWIL